MNLQPEPSPLGSPEPIGKLEPEFQDAYTSYNMENTPYNATSLLKVLQPSIQKGIRAHVGPRPGPLVGSHARKIALQAVSSYDPYRAKLSTHVINHLKGLRRVARNQQSVVPVPERVRLDANYLYRMEQEFEDENGREATTTELADYAKVSVTRIEHIRKFRNPLATGTLQARVDAGGETSGFSPAVASNAGHQAWVRAVYSDLNPTNKLIMEYTLGLNGKGQLSNADIARKLRLTPGAISQRKASIQAILNKEQELSPFG